MCVQRSRPASYIVPFSSNVIISDISAECRIRGTILTVAGYVEGNCGEQLKVTESFDVCIEGPSGYSDCKTLTNSPSKQLEEVTFSID